MANLVNFIDHFNPKLETWTLYEKRLNAYFKANDTPDEKKVPVLLSVLGRDTFALLTSLTSPTDPIDMSYKDVKDKLQAHFNPAPQRNGRTLSLCHAANAR